METPDAKTAKANWKEKIAHRKDTLLQGIEIFKDYLVLNERARANKLMRVIDQTTGKKHYLDFGEPAYTIYSSVNLEFNTDLIRYGYTSLTTPFSTFDYNMKTFTDFIDCAEFLISEKYTSYDKLFEMGGSAGGLLMGAVVNIKPELFKGVIAKVPFVDVITTMEDESIPLTTGEFDEWGNP